MILTKIAINQVILKVLKTIVATCAIDFRVPWFCVFAIQEEQRV